MGSSVKTNDNPLDNNFALMKTETTQRIKRSQLFTGTFAAGIEMSPLVKF